MSEAPREAPIPSNNITPVDTATEIVNMEEFNENIDDQFKDPNAPQEGVSERQKWGSRISFLFASIGAAIGFGNFFRFPYLVFSSGGGAFLIPYTFALIFIGVPLLLMETAIGQFTRRASFKGMRILHRRSGGIGLSASAFGGFAVSSYYCVMLSWVCVYFIHCFRYDLPWAGRADEFFRVSWPVFGGLLFVWVIVYVCVWRGVKSTGLVAYVTVPLPFILLFILLGRALFLEGAVQGIVYYLYPDFSLLLDARIWLAAAGQIFFSLGIGSGTMTAFGSFNDENQDVVSDNLIICIAETSFSLFAGFAVFSILGYMAHERGVTVPEVTASGIGLAFVVFPDAVSLMPIPHVFAVLLFVTMFTLGIDSAVGLTESVNGVIHDQFHKVPLSVISLIVCIAGFVAGIPFTLTNGFYLMDIVDHFVSDYCLIFVGICECIVVGYLIATTPLLQKIKETQALIREHGMSKLYSFLLYANVLLFHSADEFRQKMSAVSKRGPTRIWSLLIKFLIPLLLGGIWLSQIIKEMIHPYSSLPDGSFDRVSLAVGCIIVISCISVVVIFIFIPGKGSKKAQEPEQVVIEEIANAFDAN
ncbi:sodium- and chloride-dependent GABA transporter [Acrasis kona]|uniref:Sodium- and chloride-dependent GABA transporter n=1 Tax=Acrasis kona TaxID=1008807 RepID=A0AAW2YJV8_9EUKA